MSINELIDVPLNDDERAVLSAGLAEWGGPARCTPPLAVAMGFTDRDDLLTTGQRIREALSRHEPLTQRDWVRTLVATEVCFSSDVLGSGIDWATTTGIDDEQTIRVLRQIQRKIPMGGFSIDILLSP